MLTDKLPRVRLASLPTPIQELPRLGAELGIRLFVKRDDLSGLAGGGNKTRKLEFAVGEAMKRGCDSLITVGAVQSNHCRQTAAAAAAMGLGCILVLRGEKPKIENGNLLLDRLLGARVVFSGERSREEVASAIAAEEAKAGRKPFSIPVGASDEYGSVGFVAAMEEYAAQAEALGLDPDRIILASSSFGTQAGMCLGAKALGLRARIEGISIDSSLAELQAGVSRVANADASRLGLGLSIAPSEVIGYDGYLGGGYAVMGKPEREAIELAARKEGLLLDPVYTGRAMAGLIDLARRGAIAKGETLLFWHTGGSQALYAYAEELLS